MIRRLSLGIPLGLALLSFGGVGQAGAGSSGSEPRLMVGERLRVTVAGQGLTWNLYGSAGNRHEGIYLGSINGALALEPKGSAGDTLLIPPAKIVKVEMVRGRKSHGVSGAAAGALVGALIGVAAVSAVESSDEDRVFGYLIAAPVGAGGGFFIGAIVGLMIKSDRWVVTADRNHDIGLMVRPGGGPGMGLTVRF